MLSVKKIYPAFVLRRGTRTKALFALSLVCFFWGTTWIASKEGVKHMPALQLAGIRQLAGGLLYAIYFMSKGRVLPKGKEWRPIIILAVLNFVLSNGLSTWGVKYISAGLASIIGATYPLWVVVIAIFGSKTKLPLKSIVGFLLGFTGICIIFYEHLEDFLNKDFVFGIAISFIATWSWAYGTLYTKEQAKTFNPYFSLGLQMIIAGSVLLVVTKSTNMWIPIATIPWQSWASIGFLLVFSSIISFLAFLYALQHLSAQQTAIYAYINPLVAILFGWLLLQEKMNVHMIFGTLITLAGVYLVKREFKKQPIIEQ